LPEHPSLLIFHPLEKEFSQWIYRWFAGKAIINILVVHVCLEPEFIGIVKEYPAKKEKSESESEGRLIQFLY
jgi:hypothetical protein